ncbi:MAG: endonuclease/exonuclease/phosphatase family protein [Actinobacteria bacterium]|nr:endonuclease/exonuclease/phosphatase family protein [Actinomycetota bacterium]
MNVRVLFLNTYLLRPVTIPVPGRPVRLGAPPGWRQRAFELGPRLRGRADVLALAEVWEWRDRDTLLGAWPAAERPTVAEGPAAGPLAIRGSGLRTFVDGHPVSQTASTVFSVRGNLLVDADVLANKGVLLTSVVVGDGVELEIYSTHLCWGGGLLPSKKHPEGVRPAVRAAQVAELASFIRRTHSAGSPILVVGDFNLAAAGPDGEPTAEYQNLCRTLAELGLEDAWVSCGNPGGGYTCDLVRFEGQLGAEDPDDGDLLLDESGVTRPVAPSKPRIGAINEPARIDLAFYAAGEGAAAALGPVTMRRAAFARHGHVPTAADPLRTLSDHAGLLVTLAG